MSAVRSDRTIPFPIGTVAGNGQAIYNERWLGIEVVAPFRDASNPQGVLNGELVRYRCVRNVSGVTLTGKNIGKPKKTAGKYGCEIEGYTHVLAEKGYPIDHLLPSSGVPNNYLFWVVVEGPAIVRMPATDVGDIAVGDVLVTLNGTGLTATNAGRVTKQDLTGEGADLANQIQNRIGYAQQARDGAETDEDLLITVIPQ